MLMEGCTAEAMANYSINSAKCGSPHNGGSECLLKTSLLVLTGPFRLPFPTLYISQFTAAAHNLHLKIIKVNTYTPNSKVVSSNTLPNPAQPKRATTNSYPPKHHHILPKPPSLPT